MKTVYVARAAIPSQSANSIHVMKICEAFAELCSEFELIVPESTECETEDLFDFYGVKHRFSIQRIRQRKFLGGLYRYWFAISAILLTAKNKNVQIITREPIVAFLAVLLHKKQCLTCMANWHIYAGGHTG